jgi:hypothetical protein
MHNSKTKVSKFNPVTVSNFAGETNLLGNFAVGVNPLNGNRTFGGGTLGDGDFIRLTAWGRLSSIATNQGNLTIKVYLPTEGGGSVAYTTGAFALPAALAAVQWRLECSIVIGQGPTNYSCAGLFVIFNPFTTFPALTTAVTLDPTAHQSLEMTVNFTQADMGNTITLNMALVEYLPSP